MLHFECCSLYFRGLKEKRAINLVLGWQQVLGVAQVALLVRLPAQLAQYEGAQARLQRLVIGRLHLQQVAASEAQLQM